ARRFGSDGRNVFVRDLASACLRAFDFDLRRVAGLLADLLVRGGLVPDVKNLRRVRREEQDAGLVRDAKIRLVQDGPAEFESFEVAGLAVGVGAREHTLALRQPAVK